MIRSYFCVALLVGVLAGCAAGQVPVPKGPQSVLAPSVGQPMSGHGAHFAPTLVEQAGALYTWGDNDAGQLGVGTISDAGNNFDQDAATPEPALLPAGTQVISMAAGLSDTAVATTTGAVYVTGYNAYGQLGNKTKGHATDVTSPVLAAIPSGVSITTVSIGHDNVLALSTTGALYSWGENIQGEAGTGSTNKVIDVPGLVPMAAGTRITAIGTGGYHDLAVTSAGAVLAWGLNSSGQLGNGQTANSLVPVSVALPTGEIAVAVAGGDGHSLALASDGTVWAWGLNGNGQLGDGTETSSSVPVEVELPSGEFISSIAAGENYSIALATDGSIWAWGDNASANLGDGNRVDSDIPVQVHVPASVTPVQIAAGGNRCHLLSSAAAIYDWGSSENGGHTDLTPVLDKVPAGETPVAIADGVEAEQYLAAMVPTAMSIVTAGAFSRL